MKRHILIFTFLLFAVSGWSWPVQAQSPCAHVSFRLDTAVSIDKHAICEAAQPWADDGYRIFIFLTDDSPASENDWFTLLDLVEAEVGLRDLSQADSFSHNGLAIEASTASVAPWSPTITYGTWLFDTNLDANETNLTQLKDNLRAAIQSGNASAGFAQTLEHAYAVNNPPPYGAIVGGSAAAAAALGAAGFAGYKYVARPAMTRRRRRREQLAHLGVIRQNIANLLLACDRLVSGETIDDAVIYQLFAAYGGEKYPAHRKAARKSLKQSRAALRSAFHLRRTLEIREDDAAADAETKAAPLEKQIHDWEMIYLTLVGNSEEIHSLTEAELRDLLDPMIILEREERDIPLAEQLNDIRREIEGMPFKITLREVNLEKADKKGILGHLAQVEAQIAELMEAQVAAPEQLDEARRDHLAVKEAADQARPFGLTGSEIATEITRQLTKAEVDLEAGVYLDVLATAVSIQRDLDIIENLIDGAADHAERQTQRQAITDQGYRPAAGEAVNAEIDEDLRQIKTQIGAGDYEAVSEWLDELDTDSQRALEGAAAWREQHQFNAESLALLREELTRLERDWIEKTVPAWEKLVVYPQGNWKSVTDGPEKPSAALRRLREEQLPHIEQLNSLDTQQIPEAETLLVEAGATMGAAERQLGVIINRLAEVETAVAHLPEGLGLAAADLERAIQYRDAEDAKIGPEIDQKLAEADKRLVEARQMAEERQFIAAAAMQTAVRETAVAAYAEAEAQVKQINELQKQLGTARETAVIQTTAADREIASLDALMRMNKTADLAREMGDKLSTARQAANQTLSLEDHALTTALATAVAAFIAAGEIAQQTEKRAQQDRKTYRQQQRETQKAINDAKRAIQTADNKVRHRHARRSGRQSLARARKTLPLMLDGREATRSALIRVKKQAAQAQTYAEDARRKAEQAIERRRREQQTASSGWTFSSGSGFSSSSGSKPRPRPRPRPSHSSSGSSHRPRSSGSSRRSSSSGSSRRSSGGRSRRR